MNPAEDYILQQAEPYLEPMTTANRKMMRSLRYGSLEEINDAILTEILQDAYTLRDKKFYK
jgi:hypothetical protein